MSETVGDNASGCRDGPGKGALSAWLIREFSVIIFDRECRKYYHAALMSGPAAPHVLDDPFGFARAAGQQQGRLAVSGIYLIICRFGADNRRERTRSYIRK